MKKIILIFATFLIAFSSSLAQSEIEGIWYNTMKTGKVKIVEVEGKFFGEIVWLEEPIDEKTGKPKTDINNPNESKHQDAIIGLDVLEGFVCKEKGVYVDGKIYDPENGKTYSCKMTLKDNDNLDVRGYIGFSLLGRTEKWTRTN